MQNWEYRAEVARQKDTENGPRLFISVGDDQELELWDALGHMGTHGWELAGIHPTRPVGKKPKKDTGVAFLTCMYIFKRPVEDDFKRYLEERRGF